MEQNTQKRTFQGTVVSAKMDKTVTVLVESTKVHPKYGKQYRVSKKYHVHDEKGEAQVGDVVRFEETRPLSKTKRWRVIGKVDAHK
jgi:small subunit ribosomal protein S17